MNFELIKIKNISFLGKTLEKGRGEIKLYFLDKNLNEIKVNKITKEGDVYNIETEKGNLLVSPEHRVYVKVQDGIGDTSYEPSSKIIKFPLKSSNFDFSLSSLEKEFINDSGLSCGILNQTTENIFSLGNLKESVKCLSFVTNTLSSDLESSANLPFESSFDLKTALNPNCLRNFNNSFFTFSSKRNLSCFSFNTDDDIIISSCDDTCIVQSCFNMFSCERCLKTCENFFDGHSSFQHLKNLPDHNSSTFESGCSTTNFTVCNNIFINFNSHDEDTDKDIFKVFDLSDYKLVKLILLNKPSKFMTEFRN